VNVQASLARREVLSQEHWVDAGYLTAQHLVESQKGYGVTLLGPVMQDPSWQAKVGKGFDISAFRIDWEQKQATCPQGKTSASWKESRAEYGMEIVYIQFHQKDCAVCPVREDCTQTKSKRRTITVNAQPYHEALQAARARQKTEAFKEQYRARAGIEGTISQGVRGMDLRRARYRGLVKTRLQHYATAAAINVVRLGEWLLEHPRATTRTSRFLALAQKVA
jgi:transposase